jgi:hypothetical protein
MGFCAWGFDYLTFTVSIASAAKATNATTVVINSRPLGFLIVEIASAEFANRAAYITT